jgi:hypothetical protein
VFALVAPKSIVSNLIAGAVAEAGALQAGDMMQGEIFIFLNINDIYT